MTIFERLSGLTKSSQFPEAIDALREEIASITATIETMEAELLRLPFEGRAADMPNLQRQVREQRDQIALLQRLEAEATGRQEVLAKAEAAAALNDRLAAATVQLPELQNAWRKFDDGMATVRGALTHITELTLLLRALRSDARAAGLAEAHRRLIFPDASTNLSALETYVQELQAASQSDWFGEHAQPVLFAAPADPVLMGQAARFGAAFVELMEGASRDALRNFGSTHRA